MLVVNNVCKSFDERKILDNVSFSLKENEVVGLIGANGVGKSTLLKILMGEEDSDSGSVQRMGALAYLPQFPVFGSKTAGDFLDCDAYKADQVLNDVGLNLDLTVSCLNLSGGQKTKLGLAKLLLKEPSILLLDEPTNNLDLESLAWLEKFVSEFKGSVLLTSHDRHFLDAVVDRVLELKDGLVKSYGGNYTFYKTQKQAEALAYAKKYSAQQKKIEQIQEDIDETENKAKQGEIEFSSRQPYFRRKVAKGAKTAVVRKAKLEKLLESENYLEKPEQRKNYNFGFLGEVPSSKLILEAKNVSKAFGALQVLKDVSLSVRGAEHIWLHGANGSGKSTLLKVLIGELSADSGEVVWGTAVKFGYFSQDATKLNLKNSGIQELKSTGATDTACFTCASYLHLSEKDLRKRAGDLSRGQLVKLEFAKLLLGNFQILILDEPTNHLEIETREEIESALLEYKGAILTASHDRYFVGKIGFDRMLGI